MLRKLDRYEEALADLNRTLEIMPNNAFALAARGEVLRKLDRYGEALADLVRAIGIKPNDAFARKTKTLIKKESFNIRRR